MADINGLRAVQNTLRHVYKALGGLCYRNKIRVAFIGNVCRKVEIKAVEQSRMRGRA